MSGNGASPAKIVPVILSGGAGSRLWPLSRESFPKQLLPLTTEHSLLQQTAERIADRDMFEPPIVMCNAEHRFVIAEQLRGIGVDPDSIVLEPVAKNTAPAVATAALMLVERQPDIQMLVLPSDHSIEDAVAFASAVRTASFAAADGALVTFGIKPSRAETGYGYIRRGNRLGTREGCYEVRAFVEKPDAATARSYLDDGGYEWNSGMFLFTAEAYLAELERFEPDIVSGCRTAVKAASKDLDFLRLAEAPFAAMPSRSIDYAVMERTERAAVVPADMGWSDVGSWTSLWEIGAKDGKGNVLTGDVVTRDVRNSYIRSDGPLVAVVGLDDIVVVSTGDAVLVLAKDRAQEVKALVDTLKSAKRREATHHPRVYRPWGFYQTLHDGERFQVKRITVNVGASLSLQMHHHRAEHWIVVNGTAQVTRGNEQFILNENESTYISPCTVHRLANPGKVPLNLIEVQSGDYLGEDDIIRYEDKYGRILDKLATRSFQAKI